MEAAQEKPVEAKTEDRFDIVVANRKLGTCTGVDQIGDFSVIFYDVKLDPSVAMINRFGTNKIDLFVLPDEQGIIYVSKPYQYPDEYKDWPPDQQEKFHIRVEEDTMGWHYDLPTLLATLPRLSPVRRQNFKSAAAQSEAQVSSVSNRRPNG